MEREVEVVLSFMDLKIKNVKLLFQNSYLHMSHERTCDLGRTHQ